MTLQRLGQLWGLALLGSLLAAAHAQVAHAEPADPGVATPAQPYGGQLADAGGPGVDASVFEVGLLGLGGVNALALVGASVLDSWRGPTCAQTRQALMVRTDPGRPPGRRSTDASAASQRTGAHRRLRAA